jgi:class 3 adenylate cyclase
MNQPQECTLIVAMVDIAGFAKACEGKPDMDIFRMLNKFYYIVGKVVGNAGGAVLKFMGDSALMVFTEEKAKPAVTSLRELKILTQPIWTEFDPTCRVRTKAEVCTVVCGPMGMEKRMDIIGNSLNRFFAASWDGTELSRELRRLVEE